MGCTGDRDRKSKDTKGLRKNISHCSLILVGKSDANLKKFRIRCVAWCVSDLSFFRYFCIFILYPEKMKKHIPNTLTTLNLVSGLISITMVMQNHLVWAAVLIFLAAVFDYLDGTAARLLKAY